MNTLTPDSIQPADLTATRESIKQLLLTSDRAVYRALVVLYERQTSDEQASATTTHKNGRGFSSFDAEFLTSLTQQYQRRGCLSPKQIACARKKVGHYTGQLLEAAEAKRTVGTQVALWPEDHD
jgi:hypothetical protein